MGRILEALKKAETDRPRRKEIASLSHLASGEVPGISRSDSLSEIPFIEVGGSGPMEASPSVLAHGPAAKGKSTARRGYAEKLPLPTSSVTKVERVVELGPLSLSFHPLPCSRFPVSSQQRFGPELVAFHDPQAPLADQYRTVLAGLVRQLPEVKSKVLLFSAPFDGPFQTTVVLNLAITWVRQGKKVAVVDGGASSPDLSQRLGLPLTPGLVEGYRGSVPLSTILRETGLPLLQVITAGTIETESVPTDAIHGLFRKLRDASDLVLINAPAWDGGQKIKALGGVCDMAFLVMAQAESQTPKMEILQQAISRQGCNLGGLILTCP